MYSNLKNKVISDLRGVVSQEKIYNTSIAVAYVCYKAKVQMPNIMLSFDYRLVLEKCDDSIINDFLSNTLKSVPKNVYNSFFSYDKDQLSSIILESIPENYKGCVEYTPEYIIDLANKILDIKEDDLVSDICTGIGTYIYRTAKQFPNSKFIGYEIDLDLVAISRLKSEIINANNKCLNSDNINIHNLNILENETKTKADKAFMHMPFGQRASFITNLEEIKRSTPLLSSLKRSSSLDWAFIINLLKSLKKNGVGIALTTIGTTFNLIDSKFREYLVKNGYIKAIIALPERLMSNSSVKTIMYVLSENNKAIKMVDATDCYTNERRQNKLSVENIEEIYNGYLNETNISRTVSVKEIEKEDFILLPNRYLSNISYKNGVKLSEFITVDRGAPLRASELDKLSSIKHSGYQYLMLSDVSNGLINNDLHNITDIDSTLEKYIIKEDNLILSKIGTPFKVAIMNNRDSKILANGNLYIVKIDKTKANPYYVQAFLQSDQGQEILQSKAKGVHFSSLSKRDLLDIEIPLPSLEEQNKIGSALKETLIEIVNLNDNLEREKMKIASFFSMKKKRLR